MSIDDYTLDTSTVPDNPWMKVLEVDALQLIERVAGPLNIDFGMTESTRIQATAIFSNPPKIRMTFGLADAMCRLANGIITSGIFVDFGDVQTTWSPTIENSVVDVQTQLKDEPFKWHTAFVPWMADGERQIIFAYLLLSMSRFVVLHEIGHIGYQHWRGEAGPSTRLDAIEDGKASDEESRMAAITSQSKEIAADGYAFNLLRQVQDAEFAAPHLDPMRRLLSDKIMGTPRLRLRWSLLIGYLVFQLLDRRTWNLETARLATHPPAPFRVKALYAAALNIQRKDLPDHEIVEEVKLAHILASAVIDVGLKRFPNLSWVNQVDGEAFDIMFNDIYAELQKWTTWS